MKDGSNQMGNYYENDAHVCYNGWFLYAVYSNDVPVMELEIYFLSLYKNSQAKIQI